MSSFSFFFAVLRIFPATVYYYANSSAPEQSNRKYKDIIRKQKKKQKKCKLWFFIKLILSHFIIWRWIILDSFFFELMLFFALESWWIFWLSSHEFINYFFLLLEIESFFGRMNFHFLQISIFVYKIFM